MTGSPLPLADVYRGKSILLTGGAGFLGKVWLAQALCEFEDIGEIFVLLRPKDGRGARRRFERFVNTSPCFRPVREKFGSQIGARISRVVTPVEGDVSLPRLGLDDETYARLSTGLDLVIHCAGNVDFNPDPRDAVSSNVEGVRNIATLVRESDRARLVHVSTCYVAGERQGFIPERLLEGKSPKGRALDAETELIDVRGEFDRVAARLQEPGVAAEIDRRLTEGLAKRGMDPEDESARAAMRPRYEKRWLKDQLIAMGQDRAAQWGWRNIYTWSKALAEEVMQREVGDARWAILRPAIIESALEFPFPGWNEGLNASGPIVHLLGTWFRLYPAKKTLSFDVIPVDIVTNALTTVGAAVLRGENGPVYQVGTSTRNPFTMGRATELSALGHRRHLKSTADGFWRREVLARWDAVNVDVDHPFRLENVVRAAGLVEKASEGLLSRLTGSLAEIAPDTLREPAERTLERSGAVAKNSGYLLGQIDRMLNAFRPFIYDDHHEFESKAIDEHRVAEDRLRFAPERIRWREYWMDIHMPGLREWVWPQIAGRDIPSDRPEHEFAFVAATEQSNGDQRGSGATGSVAAGGQR